MAEFGLSNVAPAGSLVSQGMKFSNFSKNSVADLKQAIDDANNCSAADAGTDGDCDTRLAAFRCAVAPDASVEQLRDSWKYTAQVRDQTISCMYRFPFHSLYSVLPSGGQSSVVAASGSTPPSSSSSVWWCARGSLAMLLSAPFLADLAAAAKAKMSSSVGRTASSTASGGLLQQATSTSPQSSRPDCAQTTTVESSSPSSRAGANDKNTMEAAWNLTVYSQLPVAESPVIAASKVSVVLSTGGLLRLYVPLEVYETLGLTGRPLWRGGRVSASAIRTPRRSAPSGAASNATTTATPDSTKTSGADVDGGDAAVDASRNHGKGQSQPPSTKNAKKKKRKRSVRRSGVWPGEAFKQIARCAPLYEISVDLPNLVVDSPEYQRVFVALSAKLPANFNFHVASGSCHGAAGSLGVEDGAPSSVPDCKNSFRSLLERWFGNNNQGGDESWCFEEQSHQIQTQLGLSPPCQLPIEHIGAIARAVRHPEFGPRFTPAEDQMCRDIVDFVGLVVFLFENSELTNDALEDSAGYLRVNEWPGNLHSTTTSNRAADSAVPDQEQQQQQQQMLNVRKMAGFFASGALGDCVAALHAQLCAARLPWAALHVAGVKSCSLLAPPTGPGANYAGDLVILLTKTTICITRCLSE